MKSNTAAYLAVAFLLSLISPSSQLQCYSCLEGRINVLGLTGVVVPLPSKDCDGYSDDVMVQCPQPQPACLSVTISAESQSASVKGCVDVSKGSQYICDNLSGTVSKAMQASTDCRTCTDDACNAGTSLTASLAIIMSHVVLYKILF